MTIGKWVSLGCGSYRRVRTGVYEVNYRPQGSTGKQVRRLVPATEEEIKELIRSAARNKARQNSGLAPSVTWLYAKMLFKDRLTAKGNVEKYVAEIIKTIDELKEKTGASSPADVDAVIIENWLNEKAKAAQAAQRPGWARTCNKSRTIAGTFFRFLMRRRMIQHNPVDAVEPFRQTRRPPRALTPDEYARVWAACEAPVRDLLDFLLITGCRFGEAAAMKFGDVDEKGIWTCQKRKGRDYLRQELPKVLLDAIARQPKEKDGLIWRKHRTTAETRCKDGAEIDVFWLKRVLAVRCKRANVKRFSAHALRHAAATWASAAGASPWAIKAHLGHAQLSTTERYSDLSQSGSKLGVEVIDKIRLNAIQSIAQ
jgi:integrase/recombinase XerD